MVGLGIGGDGDEGAMNRAPTLGSYPVGARFIAPPVGNAREAIATILGVILSAAKNLSPAGDVSPTTTLPRQVILRCAQNDRKQGATACPGSPS